MTFSEADIDDFIKAEAPYHGGSLSREKAVQYMAQRERFACPQSAAEKERAYWREFRDWYGDRPPRNLMDA